MEAVPEGPTAVVLPAVADAEEAEAAVGVGVKAMKDRFGLGWRPELSASILSNLDEIDIVEVIADDYFDAPSKSVRALSTLSGQVPISLHAVGLGMASTIAVDEKRLDAMARLAEKLRPESWSEHLAFVRAGGVEIGHLAAPPRNGNSIEGTVHNIEKASQRIGSAPAMENVATLIDPPGSTCSESEWLSSVLRQSKMSLLLDLHNVCTNANNFDYDPFEFLRHIPLERVQTIHIAGGRWLGKRILDDHLHPVPGMVFDLLRHVAAEVSQPLTVILERDGDYPPMEELLAELAAARAAVVEGRRYRAA